MNSIEAICTSDHQGMRADQYIADVLQLASRSQLKQRIATLTVNGTAAKLSHRLRNYDRLVVVLLPPVVTSVQAEEVLFPILYEDERIMVIDKPQGMVVHPGAGHHHGTVLNGVLFRLEGEPESGDEEFTTPSDWDTRPGIVHRLDKETSGVLVVAKRKDVHAHLVEQFAQRRVHKRYVAIVRGRVALDRGTIGGQLVRDKRHRMRFAVSNNGGKEALTRYRVLQRFPGYALVLLVPHTGRTHQLRVHMQSLGCPILGDPLYARPDPLFRDATLMLHAFSISLSPCPDCERLSFHARLPQRFRDVLRQLRLRGTTVAAQLRR